MLKSLTPMTHEEILEVAPSVGAVIPYPEVSDRYTFVPTLNVIDLLEGQGWFPVKAQEAKTRKEEKAGFQKHLVRFHHPDLMVDGGEEMIEAVLLNSHDRSCAYQIMIGVYRMVCANGMIVGETFSSISVRHMNYRPEEIIEAGCKITEYAPKLIDGVRRMKSVQLTDQERVAFASSAMQLVYEPEEAPIDPVRLLASRRSKDSGNDLWRTFNKVQENIIRGGLRGRNPETFKRITTKAVKSIDKNIKLNRALWTLTEKMMELKTGLKPIELN